MSKRHCKKERTIQTYRLFKLLDMPVLETEQIDIEKFTKEIQDCIDKGADLQRRIYGNTFIIWYAIKAGHDPIIIKTLMEAGGLFENIRIINCQTYTRKSDRNLYYTRSLAWVISEIFDGLEEYKQLILNMIKEGREEEGDIKCIKELDLTMKRYQEYKQVFDIEKFDLDFCRKNGYYD
jgi:hypothetical protein